MYFPLYVGILCLSLFCYALLCVHSSFAIILKMKKKLFALLILSYRCIVTINVLWLFLTVPWFRLQCVNVVFSDHTHLPLEDRNVMQSHHIYMMSFCDVKNYRQLFLYSIFVFNMTCISYHQNLASLIFRKKSSG